MNTKEIVRRIRAFQGGKALPRGDTRHVHIADDTDLLIAAFVRMGGESRPWGVAYGHPGKEPTILTVPEARNRELVAEMMSTCATTFLEHFLAPGYAKHSPKEPGETIPLRQVWLPNPTHLDMLHHLSYAYTFTRSGGEHRSKLQAFGRLCGWLFREAQRPGEQHVVVATDALRDGYTFPAEDVRQGHLGYLLAWLETRGTRERRMAAAMAAEQQSIATTLDPKAEKPLGSFVEEWGEADKKGDRRAASKAARKVHESLADELSRRCALTADAVAGLRADRRRVNRGVPRLISAALDEQWQQYFRIEHRINSDEDGPAFVPSPETDRHPAAAGSRYLVHEASADLVDGLLLLDDQDLQAEAIAAGDAFRGVIRKVWNEGVGRAVRPVWFVIDAANHPLRLRSGATVQLLEMPKRLGRIRKVEPVTASSVGLEIEITELKTAAVGATPPHDLPPIDKRWIGETVTFTKQSAEGIARRKSYRIWDKDVPGAWLTHSRPVWHGSKHDDVDINDVAEVEQASPRRESR